MTEALKADIAAQLEQGGMWLTQPSPAARGRWLPARCRSQKPRKKPEAAPEEAEEKK